MIRTYRLALFAAVFLFFAGDGFAENISAFLVAGPEKYGSMSAREPMILAENKTSLPSPEPRRKRKVPVVPVDSDLSGAPKGAGVDSGTLLSAGDVSTEAVADSATPALRTAPTVEEELEREDVPPVTTGWYYVPRQASKPAPVVSDRERRRHAPRPEPTYDEAVPESGMGPDGAETRISYLFDPADIGRIPGSEGLTAAHYCEKISREGRECHMGKPYLVIETLLTLREFCVLLENNKTECIMKDPLTLVLAPPSGGPAVDAPSLTISFERHRDTFLLKKLAKPDRTFLSGPDAAKFLTLLAAPFLQTPIIHNNVLLIGTKV